MLGDKDEGRKSRSPPCTSIPSSPGRPVPTQRLLVGQELPFLHSCASRYHGTTCAGTPHDMLSAATGVSPLSSVWGSSRRMPPATPHNRGNSWSPPDSAAARSPLVALTPVKCSCNAVQTSGPCTTLCRGSPSSARLHDYRLALRTTTESTASTEWVRGNYWYLYHRKSYHGSIQERGPYDTEATGVRDLLQNTPWGAACAATAGRRAGRAEAGETPPSALRVTQELTLLAADPSQPCHTVPPGFQHSNTKGRARGLQRRAARTRCPRGPAVRRPRSPRSTPLRWQPRPGSGDRRSGRRFSRCFWRQDPGPAAGPAKASRESGVSEWSTGLENHTPPSTACLH